MEIKSNDAIRLGIIGLGNMGAAHARTVQSDAVHGLELKKKIASSTYTKTIRTGGPASDFASSL